MTRLRYRGSTSLALVLALAWTQAGRTQPEGGWATKSSRPSSSMLVAAADSAERSYKIYSLDELGGDPGFGEWIAQTIPEVIAAGTWKGPGVIRYYAPKNILVVCHTPAVQAKVDGFLKDVKKSLPDAKRANAAAPKGPAPGHEVVQAAYQAPSVLKASGPAAESGLSYPVPAQAKAPKHLFHFIVRYEGEGIIDDSVVRVLKSYFQAERKAAAAAAPVSAPAAANPANEKEEKKEEQKDKEKKKEQSEGP